MAQSTRTHLTQLFFVISGVAATSAVFVATVYGIALPSLLVLPLLVEAFGSYGLAENVAPKKLHKGLVVNILQWISGVIGLAALFDGVMRFMRFRNVDQDMALTLDAVLVLLFFLWMVVSHLINKDAQRRNMCEFC